MTEHVSTPIADTQRQKEGFARKAFFVFAFNSIASSLGITVCSLVDAIIVGNVYGETGLAVTGVILPIYMLYNLLSFAIGVGGSTQVAHAFGKEDRAGANRAFSFSVALGLLAGVVISVFGMLLLRPLVSLLGGGGLKEAMTYAAVLVLPAPIFVVAPILGLMLRADADPGLSTAGVVLSCIVNMVLDIVFVVVLDMGIHGAALAMVIGQGTAVGTYLFHFFKKRAALRPLRFVPSLKWARELVTGGLGTASAYAWQGIYIVVFNHILSLSSGSTGLAIFNAVFNVSLFAYAIFDGIALSIPALVGTYLGEGDNESIRVTVRLSMRLALSLSLFVTVGILLLAQPLVRLFGLGDATATLGALAIRLYSPAVICACLNVLLASYYQTIKFVKLAGISNFLRGCVFMLCFGIPLILTQGAKGAALAIAAAEACCLLVTLLMAKAAQMRRELDSMLLIDMDPAEQPHVFEVVLGNDFSQLPAIVEQLGEFCEENDVGPKETYLINLTIEELAANIIQFGFANTKNHYIAIRVTKYDDDIYVRLRDDATDYNPFEQGGESNEAMDFIGVQMIQKKAKDFIYQRKLVFNNLLIIL